MSNYTFHLVGLGLTVDVEADSERLAVLKIYDGLTEAQIFDLEWCDLVESDVSSFKAANDTADALWVACVCPFFCAWQWVIKFIVISIDSYFDGWLGIVILSVSTLFFAYVGSFGYVIAMICVSVAMFMITDKFRR